MSNPLRIEDLQAESTTQVAQQAWQIQVKVKPVRITYAWPETKPFLPIPSRLYCSPHHYKIQICLSNYEFEDQAAFLRWFHSLHFVLLTNVTKRMQELEIQKFANAGAPQQTTATTTTTTTTMEQGIGGIDEWVPIQMDGIIVHDKHTRVEHSKEIIGRLEFVINSWKHNNKQPFKLRICTAGWKTIWESDTEFLLFARVGLEDKLKKQKEKLNNNAEQQQVRNAIQHANRTAMNNMSRAPSFTDMFKPGNLAKAAKPQPEPGDIVIRNSTTTDNTATTSNTTNEQGEDHVTAVVDEQ